MRQKDANLLPTCVCKCQNLKDFFRYFERIRLQRQLGDSCFHPAVWVWQRDLPLTVNGRLQFGDWLHRGYNPREHNNYGQARDLQRDPPLGFSRIHSLIIMILVQILRSRLGIYIRSSSLLCWSCTYLVFSFLTKLCCTATMMRRLATLAIFSR
jgi:hypothetical protein